MNKLFTIFFTTLTVGFFSFVSNSGSAEYFAIGSGDSNKVNFSLGNAICKMVAKLPSLENGTGTNPQAYRCTAPSTKDAYFNLDQVQQGNFQFAFAKTNEINTAYTETPSETIKPFKEIRTVFSTTPSAFHIIVGKKSNIKNWKSLKNKKVYIGKEGTISRQAFDNLIDANRVNKRFFGTTFEESNSFQSDDICKNKVDAFGLLTAIPNPEIEKAITKCGAYLLEISNSNLNTILKNNSYYSQVAIKKGTYKDFNQSINTFGSADNLITSEEVSEEVVYHLVKAVFENFSAFKKENPAFNNLNIQQMIKGGLAAPLHAGAIKYYKEKGWM
jgi:TRAP transporter TAXI family solute receptor